MKRNFKRVCVYCSSSDEVDPVYFEAARALGALLAQRSMGVVFGGGRVGLMGAVANGALEAGGEVFGVIPERLMELELGHQGLTALDVVPGMHERKQRMADLSDAFIALPGGVGTLEELFEAVTWSQLNFHLKPVGLLNVAGYYDHLLAFFETAIQQRFVRPIHRNLLIDDIDAARLLERLAVADIPKIESWLSRRDEPLA